jgi:GxxExxY protein
MSDLLFKEEVFKLVGFCMEIHRELGKGHDEILYKDALVVDLQRAEIPFAREVKYEVTYKSVILPHHGRADFVIWDRILFEAKATDRLTDGHMKQVLNYLAASKLELGLLVNFGPDSLEWKRVVLSRPPTARVAQGFSIMRKTLREFRELSRMDWVAGVSGFSSRQFAKFA